MSGFDIVAEGWSPDIHDADCFCIVCRAYFRGYEGQRAAMECLSAGRLSTTTPVINIGNESRGKVTGAFSV